MTQYAGIQANVADLEEDCRLAEREFTRLKTKRELVLSSLASIEADLDELKPPTEAAASKIRKEIELAQELRFQLNTARSVLSHSEEVKAECEALMGQYRDQQKHYWLVKNTEMRLDTLRSLFHRDRLPAMVHEHYLENIRTEANDVLDGFDSDFRIESVEDLKFVVKFAGGQMTPANRLSGGQKVVLALAYRMAVHSLFANELGLLCLDEPTAGLDSRSLKVVESALSRLREVGKARRLQVILITHDPLLDNLCDTVIDLSAAS
jgi:exonuclease SbcC